MASQQRGGYNDSRGGGGDRMHQHRGGGGGSGGAPYAKSSKQTLFDLSHLINKQVRIKLIGGREVTGFLKGYDQLQNMVLDEVVEFLKSYEDPNTITSRRLGLVVVRGPSVMSVSPADGFEEIPNPFIPEGTE